MISFSGHFFQYFFTLSAFLYGIVGSNSQNLQEVHISRTNQTIIQNHTESPEWCEILLSARKDLVAGLRDLPNSYAKCDVRDNCSSLSCQMLLGEAKVKAEVSFRLCEPLNSKGVEFVVKSQRTWKHGFSHLFLFNADKVEKTERVEIKGVDQLGPGYSKSKWFIKVASNLSRDEAGQEILSLISSLQICESYLESSCDNKTLIELPRLTVGSLCKLSQYMTNMNDKLQTRSSARRKRSSRSSRAAWDPEKLHSKSNSSDTGPAGPPSHKMGDPCDTSEIFVCGDGASCVGFKESQGVCQCLKDFVADSSGICQKRPADTPSEPPSQPVNTSSSTSAALGALFSVFILLSIAAAVFFGTKYHVFSRIRNRLPLNLRCWPWPVLRRSSPLEDNVSMVNPIDQDDDEPLLL